MIPDTQERLIGGGLSVGARNGAGWLIALRDEFVGIESADERMKAIVDLRKRDVHVEANLFPQVVVHCVQQGRSDTAVDLLIDGVVFD